MKVYLASSLSNSELNARIAQLCEAETWQVFLPQRDNNQDWSEKKIAVTNTEEIIAADLIIALSTALGNDTSWEIGFAQGQAKPVVLALDVSDCAKNDLMVRFGYDYHAVICFNSSDPEKLIEQIKGQSGTITQNSTQNSIEQAALDYSFNWFRYHAEQRYKSFQLFVFQLFLAPLGLAATVAAKPQVTDSSLFWFLLGGALLLGAWLSFLFFRLDRRNEALVKLGEEQLKKFEPLLFAHNGDENGILLKDAALEQSDQKGFALFKSHNKLLQIIFATSILVFLVIGALSVYAGIVKSAAQIDSTSSC